MKKCEISTEMTENPKEEDGLEIPQYDQSPQRFNFRIGRQPCMDFLTAEKKRKHQLALHLAAERDKGEKLIEAASKDEGGLEIPQDNQSPKRFNYRIGRQPCMQRLTATADKERKRQLARQRAADKAAAAELAAQIALLNTPNPNRRPELILKKNIEVKMSHVNSLCDFYVTDNAEDTIRNEIGIILHNSMSIASIPFTISDKYLDEGYIGAYEEHGRWHRVTVSKVDKNEFEVFLIDHGDKLRVSWKHLCVCPSAVVKINALAYHCSLNLVIAADYAEKWTTNLKLKLSNLHNVCAPNYKLTVNAHSVENGLHIVTLSNGYFDNYSRALKMMSMAKEIIVQDAANTQDRAEEKFDNVNLNFFLDSNEKDESPLLSYGDDPAYIFNDSFDKLCIHFLKSTKFRVYRTNLTDSILYIVPVDNHSNKLQKQLAEFFTSNKKKEIFVPNPDEIVCVENEGIFNRVKVHILSRDKSTFLSIHLDSEFVAEYNTADALQLSKKLQNIPPVGVWVQLNRYISLQPLNTDVERFNNFLTNNVFVLTDVTPCYYDQLVGNFPFIQMRVADAKEVITISDLVKNMEHWRYELLMAIGYRTDEDFADDDKERDSVQLSADVSTKPREDHLVLEKHMNKFYSIVEGSPLNAVNIGQYLAVRINDPNDLHKWHRAVVEADNFIKCIDHLEMWKFTTEASKMIVRPLISEFFRVPPLKKIPRE